ncbi:hypothetical protein [Streptomyces lunaelactis]|uniref:hypothetical protein n=1 Tax=Streptomyces lunaelactis TaxID=1535768 RepID=UPI001584D3BB|nr:hypothetical protein [Streptomyces lunaelactis]NUK75395.1 hypothetical protein [Streptomyces lunaelactis]NUL15037.1 hypothetical protein [Streptomyces lunaelactis]NUL27091.1 hypothetical protein [Streptomyces lunaelactis]
MKSSTFTAAAEDLRALCETLVTHTPADDVADFVTEQLPEPRSAMILACVLQLTDTDDGARFWWQYAAGAGQPAAAYCLYLHHLALGEKDTADWWHQQTDDVHTPADHSDHAPQLTEPAAPSWHPAGRQVTATSTTTMLRVLRHLAKYTTRPHSAVVTELMAYIPTAVAAGYLRQPEIDLPMPGPDFADHISTLLDTATNRPGTPARLPARQPLRTRTPVSATNQPISRPGSAEPVQPVRSPTGETATR